MSHRTNSEGGLRVGFFPGRTGTTRWDEVHPWATLATDALSAAGCEVVPVDLEMLRRLPGAPEFDVIHLNWPQSLADPDSLKARKYLPHRLYKRWYLAKLEERMRRLDAADVAVVWQVHDLPYDGNDRNYELRKTTFERFYDRADGLTFYEASAQPPVFELFGPPGDKEVGVAHLGGYVALHGPRVSPQEARQRIGLTNTGRTLVYAGKVRWTRSPVEVLKRFVELSAPEDRLIVTGVGTQKLTREYSHERVLFRPGMTDHEEFRDLICASDFVINDAYRYLGSAVIRVALGYGVPVIARPFGCTADIARGALVEVEDAPQGLDRALKRALEMPEPELLDLKREALARDQERPWSAYAGGCIDVYRRAMAARGALRV